jgi:hypothetical protein
MAALHEWVIRLWGAFHPSRRDAELEQELRLHLELATDEEQRRGNVSGGAGRAVVSLGGLAQTMEVLRDQRGLPWLEDFLRDLRHAARALRRSPSEAAPQTVEAPPRLLISRD